MTIIPTNNSEFLNFGDVSECEKQLFCYMRDNKLQEIKDSIKENLSFSYNNEIPAQSLDIFSENNVKYVILRAASAMAEDWVASAPHPMETDWKYPTRFYLAMAINELVNGIELADVLN